jgi:hypothetical protein
MSARMAHAAARKASQNRLLPFANFMDDNEPSRAFSMLPSHLKQLRHRQSSTNDGIDTFADLLPDTSTDCSYAYDALC